MQSNTVVPVTYLHVHLSGEYVHVEPKLVVEFFSQLLSLPKRHKTHFRAVNVPKHVHYMERHMFKVVRVAL